MNTVLSVTHTKAHFFLIQLTIEQTISNGKRHEGDIRTKTVDPHERTRRFPITDDIALRKPRGRATVMRFAGDILVYPWIWDRKPTAKYLLKLVTYKVVLTYMPRSCNVEVRTLDLVYLKCHFLHQD
jgi:hypothetical protein